MIVDLYAGPGGWEEGLRHLNHDATVIGIEFDKAACATRAAAGHQTIRADVSQYPTDPFVGKVSGLIASPPCPTFSMAGKGTGREDMPHLHRFAAMVHAQGWSKATEWPWAWKDPRTPLVLEPLRWVEALEPRWITLEQVPEVLPLWEQYAMIWRDRGYSVWTGLLSSERYGVPQVRERAILIAHRHRLALPPSPTHQAYVRGEPARAEWTLDGELKPWVSMAEALGWTPAAYRRSRGTGMIERYGKRPDHRTDRPAPTLTSKVRSDSWVLRSNNQPNACERRADEPASTLFFGNASNDVRWVQERPSTTVASTDRIGKPGAKDWAGGESQFEIDAVKITIQEALVLQSFQPDYPVQGSKTKAFQQVGNAIPVKLAAAVLSSVL